MIMKRQQRSSFNTTELYIHTQPFTFSPELHKGLRPLIRIVIGLGKSSQQEQTTEDYFILALKLDSVERCLCVCGKKKFKN